MNLFIINDEQTFTSFFQFPATLRKKHWPLPDNKTSRNLLGTSDKLQIKLSLDFKNRE